MAALDFTFERREELIRRDSFEEGIEKGIEKGRLEEILSSVREGDYGIERGAEKLGISVAELKKRMEED